MNSTERVAFNTIVLYIKIIVTMLISLVSVPLILKALGASDYGLYNLVAGVIALLSFLNASMTVSTQRYLSVEIGTNSYQKLNTIYNCSVVLHLLIGLLLVFIFEICGLFIFNGFLNIEPERLDAAKIIYQFIILSTFLSVITVPYGAVLNAKENMLVFSLIDIFDSLLKLALALWLSHCNMDRLIFYGAGVACISIINVFAYRIYVKSKYKEFTFKPSTFFDKTTFTNMLGFAGWNAFGSVAVIGRNQGVAIVLNLFHGTVINAAYGIANQINGVLLHFSSTFIKAINPQLMQNEGKGDRDRLLRFSNVSSKYSFLILSLFSVPLIIEMPYVLKLWLGNPPEYSIILSRLVLIFTMIYQYSNGLMSAIQAVGKIGAYQTTMGLLILLNVPISYFILSVGLPPYYCVACFILIEIISLYIRMEFAKRLVGLDIKSFSINVILRTFVSVIAGSLIPVVIVQCMHSSFSRLMLVCIVYVLIYFTAAWKFALDSQDKNIISGLIDKILKKILSKNVL